jgi:predicted RNA-binding protein YlqC (UPF0109 family)
MKQSMYMKRLYELSREYSDCIKGGTVISRKGRLITAYKNIIQTHDTVFCVVNCTHARKEGKQMSNL